MPHYEFKVIPAPRRGEKVRGVKSTEDRYALTLTNVMNELGRDGWDYVRADTLPVDERVGFTGSKTTYQNMLVFRRMVETEQIAAAIDESAPSFRSRLAAVDQPPAQSPKLGPAAAPATGAAPAVGPASSGVAAE